MRDQTEDEVGSFFTPTSDVERVASTADSAKEAPGHRLQDPVADQIAQRLHVGQAALLHMKSVELLRRELLARVYAQSFQFFEQLVIDLLLAMGYAGGRREGIQHIGQSHDGGIDAVIRQDALGLDVILLQAKRLRPGHTVSSTQVREFVGSMEAWHSRKGLFFTTGHFSGSAHKFIAAVPHRLILVDGSGLADLMINHSIGTEEDARLVFKQVQKSYFANPSHLK